MREPAKTSNQLVIAGKQRVHFGQNHAFGGFRSSLLGVFREFEFGDRTMKNGETLCVVWVLRPFNVFGGNSQARYRP
jgi:hypothetical protein